MTKRKFLMFNLLIIILSLMIIATVGLIGAMFYYDSGNLSELHMLIMSIFFNGACLAALVKSKKNLQ